jgi:ATP-dependent RNA helicase RhlE
MSFADLGLKPELLRAVAEKGYSIATPIQTKAIPAVLGGQDVLAGAQTGTGKTAAFVLPILQKLGQSAGRAPRALVLTPTRELAAQVAESARVYGKYVGLRTVVVFGGVSINPQFDALERGCDLLVATPGRLLDLAEQGGVDLRSVECFVLDEADRMLDMGFIQPIRRVIKMLPPKRQNLMFSATYSDGIRELAARILRNPTSVEVSARNATADRVEQQVYRVSKDQKRHLLAHLIDDGNWFQVLVFTRTKHGANRLAQQLEGYGIRASAIHGNKSQAARVRALADFKNNKITALVATEVAARGLDIKELPHVVNYELPNVPEDYVHRIGRTARAGTTGSAVSLVSPEETGLLRDIERMLKRSIPVTPLPQMSAGTRSGGTSRAGAAGVESYAGANADGTYDEFDSVDGQSEGEHQSTSIPPQHGDAAHADASPAQHQNAQGPRGDSRGERRPGGGSPPRGRHQGGGQRGGAPGRGNGDRRHAGPARGNGDSRYGAPNRGNGPSPGERSGQQDVPRNGQSHGNGNAQPGGGQHTGPRDAQRGGHFGRPGDSRGRPPGRHPGGGGGAPGRGGEGHRGRSAGGPSRGFAPSRGNSQPRRGESSGGGPSGRR